MIIFILYTLNLKKSKLIITTNEQPRIRVSRSVQINNQRGPIFIPISYIENYRIVPSFKKSK